MTRGKCWRFRIRFRAGDPMDVTAYSRKGALRTGQRAARLVGRKGQETRAVSAEQLWEVGYGAQKDLFPCPDETPEEMRGV